MSGHGTEPNTEPLLFPDPVIEEYIKDVDRTLLREQLRKTPAQRFADLEAMANFVTAAQRSRARKRDVNGDRAAD